MECIKQGIIVLVILIFTTNTAFCQNFRGHTCDVKILSALETLEKTNNKEAINALKKNKHLKIMFYNLSLISVEYNKHYALATSSGNGTDYILINNKYKKCPKEAISSLIAHELTHKKKNTTMEEEINAWVNETKQWIECKKHNSQLATINEKNYPLVKRLNNLEKLYKESKNNELIIKFIQNIDAYEKLALK